MLQPCWPPIHPGLVWGVTWWTLLRADSRLVPSQWETSLLCGLGQERCNSIANAMELNLSCTNPQSNTVSHWLGANLESGLLQCFLPGGWINIKMPSYQYRKSHCGDKTILRPSYLHNGISYTGKTTSLYWIRAQGSISGLRWLYVNVSNDPSNGSLAGLWPHWSRTISLAMPMG